MQTSTKVHSEEKKTFPPFDLKRLLQTVLAPRPGEKVCILIDLDRPSDIIDFAYLKNPKLPAQKKAYTIFYEGLLNGVMQELKLKACDIYAYQTTGGSNLELPREAYAPDGSRHAMQADIYAKYDIILCIGTYSATAPLTASAKQFNFRGATMHGLNDIVLRSGLSVDYRDVSRKTERLRQQLTRADSVTIDLEALGKDYHLKIELNKQEAQKSHGICHTSPDIVNLPAGEVYFVPNGAQGDFPIKLEDGTLACLHVEQGRVTKASLLQGQQASVDAYNHKLKADPATGILGELGFGTQALPFADADIQDEKILGTFHLATGRNDHLSGDVTKEDFFDLNNASHDDILFSKTKTPEIHIKSVCMKRGADSFVLIENDEPSSILQDRSGG